MEAKPDWTEFKHEPAKRTAIANPLRVIREKVLIIPSDMPVPLINLGLGEPSDAEEFSLPDSISKSYLEVLARGDSSYDYTNPCGAPAARQAIVDKFSTPGHEFTSNDVFFSFGCSGGLFCAVAAMCEEGTNMLVPSPGFALIQPIAQNLGVELRKYNLVPERDWECDIDHMRTLIDDKTTCLMFINPSNPCGTVFTKKHQLDLVALADEFKIPILADEVYYGIVYEKGLEFHSFANLTTSVPVMCTGSLSKMYCLPGWKIGWVIVYNYSGFFDEVLPLMAKHQGILDTPNTLSMHAVVGILGDTPEAYFE